MLDQGQDRNPLAGGDNQDQSQKFPDQGVLTIQDEDAQFSNRLLEIAFGCWLI
jgi:hypothetical protein